MKKKRLLTAVTALVLVVACFATPMTASAASYDRAQAVENARNWANGYTGIDWYTCSADCTNFVSTCEAYAGITSVIPSNVPVTNNIFDDWYCHDSVTTWYMVKRSNSRPIGYQTCWTFSSSWAQVGKLRTYFCADDYATSNGRATVTQYRIETASDVTALCKALKAGDIVQYGNDQHSVIISTTGTSASAVKYCGHSNPAKDKAFTYFIEDCKTVSKSVYVIHFEN